MGRSRVVLGAARWADPSCTIDQPLPQCYLRPPLFEDRKLGPEVKRFPLDHVRCRLPLRLEVCFGNISLQHHGAKHNTESHPNVFAASNCRMEVIMCCRKECNRGQHIALRRAGRSRTLPVPLPIQATRRQARTLASGISKMALSLAPSSCGDMQPLAPETRQGNNAMVRHI